MNTPTYFSIFNPSLGTTDETLLRQILFYYSPIPVSINEKLRRVGLAQGMVEFARPFAKGKPVSYIRTHKAWNIPLTEIPNSNPKQLVTFSETEVPSPELLQAGILRGYRLWRLLNGSFENGLKVHGTERLSSLLDNWWSTWVNKWKFQLYSSLIEEFWGGTIMSQPMIQKEGVPEIYLFVNRLRSETGNDVYDMLIHRISDKRGCAFTGTGKLSPFQTRNLSIWIDKLVDDIADSSLSIAESSVYEKFKVSGDAMMNVLSFGGYGLLKRTLLEKKVEGLEKEIGSFVVGLMSPASEENEAVIGEKTVYLEDDHITRLGLGNDDGDVNNSRFRIVVWKTREYVFTILMKLDSAHLQSEEFYIDLGIDLDNLVPYISMSPIPEPTEDIFFHLIYNPSSLTVTSTLPPTNASLWTAEDGFNANTAWLVDLQDKSGGERNCCTEKGAH
ncbi:Vacuolar fusion protein CCZ1 [Neolecta irregularis DAH-3]|uniref:Vacuolar fusion protein CCZ1 n=1 Tax=Neolecta irregularis (strain DAH-3) TaxID=1198029 RepID=A0A1U7LUR9_NEOID|nr:Vacuolar fusion protein CCZ1 [Neolecta irregularis DAH-3]|eukprot:OLL26420.1 Vacuolar fusion protein CCZ1 [Neolecta irregularis DAH-3]